MSVNSSPGYGHPDFSAPLSVLDGPESAWNANVNSGASAVVATVNLTGFQSLGLMFDDTNEDFTFFFYWNFPGRSFQEPEQIDQLAIPDFTQGFWAKLIARAPLVTIIARNDAADLSNTSGWYWATNRVTRSPANGTIAVALGGPPNVITPGWNYAPTEIAVSGAANVSASCTEAYDLDLEYYDGNGSWVPFWWSLGQAANESVSQYVSLPGAFIRIGINNTSGSNGTANAGLTLFGNDMGS